jgi:phosphate acetyltransferase
MSTHDQPSGDSADALLAPLLQYLRSHPKRIVFPDGEDERVLRAASQLAAHEAVAPILLGRRSTIHALAKKLHLPMDFVGVIEPAESDDFLLFCERYRKIARYRKIKVDDPSAVMRLPVYYASMMVQYGYADGLVGGNQSLPSAFYRGLFHMIRKLPGLDAAGSCLPMTIPSRPDLGSGGTLFLSDCAVLPSPTVSQLAMLAIETARVAAALLREKPRVALISSNTRGTANNAISQRIAAAIGLAREQARREHLSIEIDGELEMDAAIHPPSARLKAPNSPLHGRASVLIFPDQTSAHATYKILEHVSAGEPGGHHILGLARPAAGVSRTATTRTLLRAAVVTALRAVSYRDLISSE